MIYYLNTYPKKEVAMTTQTLKQSNDFIIFQAFAESKSYKEVVKKIEDHDLSSPNSKIFNTAKDKLDFKECYKIFKKSEKKLNKSIDYYKESDINRLRIVLEQELPEISRRFVNSETANINLQKVNIGHMMLTHFFNIKKYGPKVLSELKNEEKRRNSPKRTREVATTSRYGIVDHGSYSSKSVFSTESKTYKTAQQIIKERIRKESSR